MLQKLALAVKSKTAELFADEDDDDDDGSVPAEPVVRVDDVVASIFAAVSAFHAAYLNLQIAHDPFDTDAIVVADRAAVSHLRRLSDLHRNPALVPAIRAVGSPLCRVPALVPAEAVAVSQLRQSPAVVPAQPASVFVALPLSTGPALVPTEPGTVVVDCAVASLPAKPAAVVNADPAAAVDRSAVSQLCQGSGIVPAKPAAFIPASPSVADVTDQAAVPRLPQGPALVSKPHRSASLELDEPTMAVDGLTVLQLCRGSGIVPAKPAAIAVLTGRAVVSKPYRSPSHKPAKPTAVVDGLTVSQVCKGSGIVHAEPVAVVPAHPSASDMTCQGPGLVPASAAAPVVTSARGPARVPAKPADVVNVDRADSLPRCKTPIVIPAEAESIVLDNQSTLRRLKTVFNRLQSDIDQKDATVSALSDRLIKLQACNSDLQIKIKAFNPPEKLVPSAGVLNSVVKEVYRAAGRFNGAFLKFFKAAGGDVGVAVTSIYPNLRFLKRDHYRYAVLSHFCLGLFDGFSSNCDRSKEDSMEEFLKHCLVHPSEIMATEGEFSRFCEMKFCDLIKICSWGESSSVKDCFLELCSLVWAVRKLAMALDEEVEIFRVKQGDGFSVNFMEDVVGRKKMVISKVGFTVFPGFRCGSRLILRSKVYLDYS